MYKRIAVASLALSIATTATPRAVPEPDANSNGLTTRDPAPLIKRDPTNTHLTRQFDDDLFDIDDIFDLDDSDNDSNPDTDSDDDRPFPAQCRDTCRPVRRARCDDFDSGDDSDDQQERQCVCDSTLFPQVNPCGECLVSAGAVTREQLDRGLQQLQRLCDVRNGITGTSTGTATRTGTTTTTSPTNTAPGGSTTNPATTGTTAASGSTGTSEGSQQGTNGASGMNIPGGLPVAFGMVAMGLGTMMI